MHQSTYCPTNQSWQEGIDGAKRTLRRRLRQLCIEESAPIPTPLGMGFVRRIGQINFEICIRSKTYKVAQRLGPQTVIPNVLSKQIETVIQLLTNVHEANVQVAIALVPADAPCTKQLELPLAA